MLTRTGLKKTIQLATLMPMKLQAQFTKRIEDAVKQGMKDRDLGHYYLEADEVEIIYKKLMAEKGK